MTTADRVVVVPGPVYQAEAESWPRYWKTATTPMKRMDVPFEVESPEGVVSGEAGDYLAMGVKGEFYVVGAEYHLASYEPVGEG